MSVDFEGPSVALFERLASINGGVFQYATRRLEDWDSSPPAKQPALMLTSGPIAPFVPSAALQGQAPPLWRMSTLAVIYVQAPSATAAPSLILNPLVADVCNALLKQAAEVASPAARFVANTPGQWSTTLGGLCAACFVSGTIERSEGLATHIAIASIPIELVLTS